MNPTPDPPEGGGLSSPGGRRRRPQGDQGRRPDRARGAADTSAGQRRRPRGGRARWRRVRQDHPGVAVGPTRPATSPARAQRTLPRRPGRAWHWRSSTPSSPIGPVAGETRAAVTGAEPGFSALLLPAMTRLASSRERDFVLVIDDIQLLTRSVCQALLQAVAEGVPEGSQVALLSRLEPPSWLARTRAEGRVFELGAADLAFDDAESCRLLEGLGASLSVDQAAELVTRAEGWPVGLYLMALSLQTRGERTWTDTSMAPSGSDRFVVDYLRAEVLAGLPRRARDFLRRTSILDELDASVCDAVMGRHDSAAVLSALSRQLQLVVALDPEGHRYRYHHLLADALRADLEGQEPWLTPELHLRASGWYESHGDRDACHPARQGRRRPGRTGTLVWAGVPGCISTGRTRPPRRLAGRPRRRAGPIRPLADSGRCLARAADRRTRPDDPMDPCRGGPRRSGLDHAHRDRRVRGLPGGDPRRGRRLRARRVHRAVSRRATGASPGLRRPRSRLPQRGCRPDPDPPVPRGQGQPAAGRAPGPGPRRADHRGQRPGLAGDARCPHRRLGARRTPDRPRR